MIPDLSKYASNLRLRGSVIREIWDPVRKKWVRFSPEEMVRQIIIYYLIEIRKFNIAHIGIEKKIKLEKRTKRCDIILYDKNILPWMIIECKAPERQVDEKAIAQVVRYNRLLGSPWLMTTNGAQSIILGSRAGKWVYFDDFPDE